MGRSALAGLAAVLVASCSMQPQGSSKEVTAGQALAQMACPHRIAESNAWINYMPGPGRNPRELHVDVRLEEPTDTAVLLKSTASTGHTLILEVRTSPAAPVPGRLAYREPVPDPLPQRISFFCRGAQIHFLDKIEKVY